MARIAARVERPIKICIMHGRLRDQVAVIDAFNLPDAIKRWYETTTAFTDPLFQANTVTVRRKIDGGEEVYVATD
jgi:hypothetical protein